MTGPLVGRGRAGPQQSHTRATARPGGQEAVRACVPVSLPSESRGNPYRYPIRMLLQIIYIQHAHGVVRRAGQRDIASRQKQ